MFETLYPRKLISYHTGRYGWYIPYRPANRYRYPLCFILEKIPAISAAYRPYRRNPAVSAGKCIPDRNKKKKKKKKKKSSHSLISPLSGVTCSFLPQTLYLLDRRSPSLFQIYFLFSLSSFFFLLSWLRPMYAK